MPSEPRCGENLALEAEFGAACIRWHRLGPSGDWLRFRIVVAVERRLGDQWSPFPDLDDDPTTLVGLALQAAARPPRSRRRRLGSPLDFYCVRGGGEAYDRATFTRANRVQAGFNRLLFPRLRWSAEGAEP
jgi:hypothetical protein